MSEKPEALRFGVWRDRETEILRVSNTGEFLWHKDADARIANPGPDANPALMHLFRALRRAEVVQAENERLRDELKEDTGVIAVWRGRTERAESENERLREALTYDWDQLEACRESLREHMVEIKRLRELLTEARGAKWLVVQDNLLDRIDAALRGED